MRRSLAAALCTFLVAGVAVSCIGDRPTSPREPSGRALLDEGGAETPSIESQIDQLFPDGSLRSEAHGRDAAIQRYLGLEGGLTKARELTSDFIEWMQQHAATGALLDPNGYYEPPTTEQAVGSLAVSLLQRVYDEEGLPYDIIGRDGAVIVIGSGGGIIRAPSKHAGASFPAGALPAGTVVTLYKIPQDSPGKGPLPTGLAQFGPFYQFDVFPDQKVAQNVTVSVCQVTDPSSPFYPPGNHSDLRLGKPRHDNPSELRVLEKVDAGTLTDCHDVEPGFAALDLPPNGRGDASLRFVRGLASSAVSAFLPTPLYAVHFGLGGRISVLDEEGFSPIGAVRLELNAAPVAHVGGPYTGRTEGKSFAYTAAGSSDPDGDALTYSWNFGDGSAAKTGVAPSHTYADNGTYTVTVTVSDGALSSSASTTVVVGNAAPAITMLKLLDPTLNQPYAGQSFNVAWVFGDPGVNDRPWTWTMTWGDGTQSSGSAMSTGEVVVSHTYATPGTRTATFRIVDKDGAAASRSIPVIVRPEPPR